MVIQYFLQTCLFCGCHTEFYQNIETFKHTTLCLPYGSKQAPATRFYATLKEKPIKSGQTKWKSQKSISSTFLTLQLRKRRIGYYPDYKFVKNGGYDTDYLKPNFKSVLKRILTFVDYQQLNTTRSETSLSQITESWT